MSKFNTKEEYLKFISGWKSATNAEECKSKRVVCDHQQYNWNGFTDEEKARFEDAGYTNINNHSYTIPDGGHCKVSGWLDAPHYVFYNVLRGKDPARGFNPISKRKLQPNQAPMYAFARAAFELGYVCESANRYIEQTGLGKDLINSADARSVQLFLKPFGGKITIADLLKINREELANARKSHR